MRFKDKYHDEFNAVLLSKGERQKPQKEYIDYGKVPGSSVALYEDTGTYFPYERTVQILSKDEAQLSEMYEWLDGAGQLDLDEGGYYCTRVLSVETVTEEHFLGWTRLIITFQVQPFLFLDTPTTEITSGITIYNPGIESDPYIKITGSGEVAVSINGDIFTVNVDQFVEIEYPFAWKGVQNKGRTLSDFPKIQPGANTIIWTGTVTKFEFNGRWRTL